MNGSGSEARLSMTNPSPSPRPNNMGSESLTPHEFNNVPVVTVSQCWPTNGANEAALATRDVFTRSGGRQWLRAVAGVAQQARENAVTVVVEFAVVQARRIHDLGKRRSEEHTSELQSQSN